MRVGEVPERAGVNVETLRYYERRGLLPAPERTPSGHRRYDEETVRFVREIKDAQAVGFTLTEIAEYVRVRRRSGAPSEALRARMAEKIDQIDGRIAALRRMRDELARVVGCGCASLDHRAVAVEIRARCRRRSMSADGERAPAPVATRSVCEAGGMSPEGDTAAALVADLCGWIDRLFPDADRGRRLRAALEERFGDDARTVTAELCREVDAVAQGFSRHFELEYVADGSLVRDREPRGWPPQDPREVQGRAGSVGKVTRGRDGVAVLALDGHDGVHIAAPYLRAAFALIRGAHGVLLDLRRNRGGDLGTVTLVLDWLLDGEPTYVCDVIYRDRARQWWTTGRLADLALPRETPVSVLVGESTFSSGEGLAYHLQSRRRARIVGQRTPGAADHITPVNVSGHVRALLPEARVRDAVTGANWEGTGVVPDLPCEPADTLTVATEALSAGYEAGQSLV